MLSLVYYECPMLCTISLNGLAGALEVLSFVPGQEFEVVTVSFDPKETPVLAAAKKKAYMARYKRPEARRGLALPDRPEGVGRRRSRARSASATCGTRRRSSSPTRRASLVLTPEGKISHYLFGVEYAPKDLRLALVDAAGGQDRQRRRPAAALLLPVRPADRPLQRVDPEPGPRCAGRSPCSASAPSS